MTITWHIPKQLNPKQPHVWLASWFGSGFLNPAPGTWGSLAALPFGIIIAAFGGLYALVVASLAITIIGLWAAARFDKDMDGHDSKMIVIDEVAGQWIALLPAALNPFWIIMSFLLFRFFDILKPWPICFIDQKVDGAAGVMFDDVVAGICAAIVIIIIDGYVI